MRIGYRRYRTDRWGDNPVLAFIIVLMWFIGIIGAIGGLVCFCFGVAWLISVVAHLAGVTL